MHTTTTKIAVTEHMRKTRCSYCTKVVDESKQTITVARTQMPMRKPRAKGKAKAKAQPKRAAPGRGVRSRAKAAICEGRDRLLATSSSSSRSSSSAPPTRFQCLVELPDLSLGLPELSKFVDNTKIDPSHALQLAPI